MHRVWSGPHRDLLLEHLDDRKWRLSTTVVLARSERWKSSVCLGASTLDPLSPAKTKWARYASLRMGQHTSMVCCCTLLRLCQLWRCFLSKGPNLQCKIGDHASLKFWYHPATIHTCHPLPLCTQILGKRRQEPSIIFVVFTKRKKEKPPTSQADCISSSKDLNLDIAHLCRNFIKSPTYFSRRLLRWPSKKSGYNTKASTGLQNILRRIRTSTSLQEHVYNWCQWLVRGSNHWRVII